MERRWLIMFVLATPVQFWAARSSTEAPGRLSAT